MDLDDISGIIVDECYHLHVRLGPGLLESVYEALLAQALQRRGLRVVRQKAATFTVDGLTFVPGLRVDLLVEDRVVVELTSTETLAPVHAKQLLTYLRILNLRVGLLVNFGAPTLKAGLRRVVNNYQPSAPQGSSPRLRVRHQTSP